MWSRVSGEEASQSPLKAEARAEFDFIRCHLGRDTFSTSLLHLAVTNSETVPVNRVPSPEPLAKTAPALPNARASPQYFQDLLPPRDNFS